MMKRKRAASILEVLFAVFVALTCMLVVGATMPMATVTRGKSDNLAKATSLAQKQLEAVRALGYPNLTGTGMMSRSLVDSATPTGTNTWSFTNVDNGPVDSPAQVLPAGTGSITIEQADIDLRRVTVVVTWTEVRGATTGTRTLRLGTLIANL